MNKLTIGFIILIVIALIVFSYYSYKETFIMIGVTNPCTNLQESQCRSNNNCSVVSDSGCFLKEDHRCDAIDPDVTQASGELACSQNGCDIVKNRSECDGLLLPDCNQHERCFSHRVDNDIKCFHQTEDYRREYTTISDKLSKPPASASMFDCQQAINSDNQQDFDRYCITVNMSSDDSQPQSVLKQMVATTSKSIQVQTIQYLLKILKIIQARVIL